MLQLTTQERRALLCLIAFGMLGTGISFLAKLYAPLERIACSYQSVGKIDINKADREILLLIPGIGETLAGRILEYRTQNGVFKDILELKNIKGITDRRFEQLKDSVIAK